FAVPVDDDFRRALETLKMGRLPDYGFLGIDPASLTVQQRQQGRIGARVVEVFPATPAAATGLRSGDVITHIDDAPVADRNDLFRRVGGRLANSVVTLKIVRGSDDVRAGRPLTMKVTLSKKRIDSVREGFAEMPLPTWRGLRVEYATAAPLFSERSRELDPAGSVGVVEAARDSPPWKAGWPPGSFVSDVGDAGVTTPRVFFDVVAGRDGDVPLKLTAAPRDKTVRTVSPEAP